MTLFRKCFLAIGLSLTMLSVMASPATPQNKIDYVTLEAPQPTDTGKKVEVIEFFGYWCSYCYSFDTPLVNWVKKQGNNIVFKRVAVGFNEGMRPQQRMFYALSAMGKLNNDLHKKIFNAIQVQQIKLRNDKQIFDFIAGLGVDRDKFIEMYNSFYVQTMVDNATKMQSLYKIDGVPMIAIDGRYLTSAAIVASGNKLDLSESEIQAATLKVMDGLVTRIHQERNSDKKTSQKKGLNKK